MASKNRSNELKISRVFDAPLQSVWDAWTDVEQVAQWWGPRGFTITTHSKDLRPGGTWNYTMHGPDGTDYPNITYYHEVREREALVYDHGATADRPPLFRVSVYFEARGKQTAMEMTMALPTPEAAEEARKFIKRAGGESTWDRLAEYVEKGTSGKDVFVINRSFDEPLARLAAMWTDSRLLAHWLPPAGLAMEVIRGQIQAGEIVFGRMFGPGVEFHCRFIYLLVESDRIVYDQQFCDRDERVGRHPLAPNWPETMRTTVLFTAEDSDRTRVTVSSEPVDTATPEEVGVFAQERGGMTKGWTGSFDKLEDSLTATPA